MTSAANTGNAIERLTEAVTEQVFGSESRSEVLDALADLDAEHQAAKESLDDDGVAWENLNPDDPESVEEFARNWGAAKTALAAAVRRVEGEDDGPPVSPFRTEPVPS